MLHFSSQRDDVVSLVKWVWDYVVSERQGFDVNLLHKACCRLRQKICRLVQMQEKLFQRGSFFSRHMCWTSPCLRETTLLACWKCKTDFLVSERRLYSRRMCWSSCQRDEVFSLVKGICNYAISERRAFDVDLLHRACCRLREMICRQVRQVF